MTSEARDKTSILIGQIAKKLGQGDAIGEIRDEHLRDRDKCVI